MKPRTIKSLAALCLLLAAATGASHAQSVVYSGRLDDPANTALVSSDLTAPSFVDERAVANNVALYALDVQATGLVSIVSTGFGDGGADPYFTLFSGAGATATFIGSNDAQAFSTGGDFSFSAVLAAGAYRIALGAFANMSFAENLGSGVLGDGFVGLGVPDALGDSSYRLVVSAPVPEPAAVWLLVAGMAALSLKLSMARLGPLPSDTAGSFRTGRGGQDLGSCLDASAGASWQRRSCLQRSERAGVAWPAESTDADALADAPRRRHLGAHGGDASDELVAWHTRPGDRHGATGLLHLVRSWVRPGRFWSTCRTPAAAASTAPAR